MFTNVWRRGELAPGTNGNDGALRSTSWRTATVSTFALAVAVSACTSASSTSTRASSSSSVAASATSSATSAQAPSATPIASTESAAAAVVPVIVCQTTFGITPPPAPKAQPASLTVSAPASRGGELAVYTDSQGLMRLLAPRGWSCSAQYGADGSGGVAVYPAGEHIPSAWGAGWQLSTSSPVQAVFGSQTSACVGCAEGQACALFPSAAKDFMSHFGRPCPGIRPATETTTQLSAGVAAFTDPAGVSGDGNPSGGRYPADGVMTYYREHTPGSWTETCTLPPADKDLCTTALNYFVNSYGTR